MNLLASNEITPAVRRWKPYPAYKDSGVEWLGSVPSHWEMTNLKRIGTFQAGTGFPVEDQGRTEGQIPFYKVSDMNAEGNELWMSVHSNTVDLPIAERLGATVVAPKTIVFPKVGAALLTNKRRILKVPSCIDNNMMGFAPRKVDVMWMYYWLLGLDLGRLANPGAVPSINESQLREIPIALPIDIEQYAIVATLDRETAKIDALVAKKERLIELLQEKRAALITRAVTKGLDPNAPMKDSGVEWLGTIPAHWEVRRTKFFSTFVTSGSRGWAEYYSDEGPIFFRIGNLTRTGIDLDLSDVQRVAPPASAEGERTRVRKNDVLISITAYIGSVAVVSDELEAYVNQHIALIRPTLTDVSARWVAYCFLSEVGETQFQQLLYGGTKDGLGLDDVRNLIVTVPPMEEQNAIIAFLEGAGAKTDGLIAKIREGIEKLKEYRTALISAAVTGKIDVREDVLA